MPSIDIARAPRALSAHTWQTLRSTARLLTNAPPLLATLLSPASTLYDIPALSQRWYAFQGTPIPDPKASLVLSSISLACSVIANALLVARFTVQTPERWRIAIVISTLGWLTKTAVGVANLIVFAGLKRNGPGYSYLEGFYCAIMSTILSGLVSLLLVIHLFSYGGKRPQSSVNLHGRILILSEMSIFGLIALQSLIFSRIEGWTYLDGIFFSVVTLLTIGFGTPSPSTTAGKILVFPFSIAGIALLSNQVSLIITMSKQESRMDESYHRRLRDLDSIAPPRESFIEEAHHVRRFWLKERRHEEKQRFVSSLALLVVFWFVSGALFNAIDPEFGGFGNAMYFSYIFFLTIGYGDFTPSSPAGRSVFVLWALIAVPIMTNFVVGTIQTLLGRTTDWLTARMRENRREWEKTQRKYFISHTDLVGCVMSGGTEQQKKDGDGDGDGHDKLVDDDDAAAVESGDMGKELKSTAGAATAASTSAQPSPDEMITLRRSDVQAVLEESLALEMQCRSLLLDQLDAQSSAWLLLQTDRQVVGRRRSLITALQDANLLPAAEESLSSSSHTIAADQQGSSTASNDRGRDDGEHAHDQRRDDDELSLVARISLYRETLARFLVMSHKLLHDNSDDEDSSGGSS